jgi:AhpD family alkylhydroperoxidase
MAAVKASTLRSTLGKALMSLIDLRVSQINGCAFCVDMHARELRQHGEGWQRINSLCTWRETTLYSPRECAALAWAEALTRLPDGHAGHDATFEALREHFNDQEVVELSWTIAQINTWNRMAVGMHAPVADRPID